MDGGLAVRKPLHQIVVFLVTNFSYSNIGPMAQLSRQQKFIGNRNGGVPSIHPVRVTYLRDLNAESSTVLRWGFLLLAFLLLPLDLVQSEKPLGFLSIDCGSRERYQDEATLLDWETDDKYLDSAHDLINGDLAIRVNDIANVSLMDNAKQLRTAMAFIPGITRTRTKFCYNYTYDINQFPLGSFSFLVRAIFPSSNLTANGSGLASYSTRFYFTVDSAFITTIDLNSSEARTVELIVTPLDEKIFICLVPLEDRSSIAAISTLEVRPLNNTLYGERGTDVSTSDLSGGIATKQTSYLMLIDRSSFGGPASVRYPHDKYDRVWRSPNVPESSRSIVTSTKFKDGTLALNWTSRFEIPPQVLSSAWEGTSQSAGIPITFNISKARAWRSMSKFSIVLAFIDVDQEIRESGVHRIVDIERVLTDKQGVVTRNKNWVRYSNVSQDSLQVWYSFEQTFRVTSLAEFKILPSDNSTLPAMVNAVEFYGNLQVISARTSMLDVDAIEKYSTSGLNKSALDTAGDPCLPVPWEWLVCSIEVPPRITQINVTNKGLRTNLQADFGKLNSLTILDLSHNYFNGTLPKSIVELTALRLLNLNDNELSGGFPSFGNGSLRNLESLSLSKNQFNGTLTSLIGALDDQIVNLDLSCNQFSGDLPEELAKLRNLQILDLSHNLFSGELKFNFSTLEALKSLKLNNNRLNGMVPWSIFDRISTSINLEVNLSENHFEALNLTTWFTATQKKLDNGSYMVHQKVRLVKNNISEVILPQYPDGGEFLKQRFLELDKGYEPTSFILLGDNPWCVNPKENTVSRYLCRHNEYSPWPQTDNNKGVNQKIIIIISVVSAISLLVMATIVGHFVRKVRIRARELHEIQEALAKQDVKPPWFDYGDLKAATGDFSTENELGRGGFGSVYRAVQRDGTILAVKRLFPTEQHVADFLKEMVLISGIKHRHLIQLKGCSGKEKERMLVYEFAENKDLATALWGEQRSSVLDWSKRFNICLGVARGLSYLHEELQPKIIHRDIKSQNILLDKYYNAKIADFGLARPAAETDVTQLTLNIGGTKGYLSPEYATEGILTEKLDVYSYGILVLEIVSGRQCIDLNKPPDQQYLRIWAKYLQEKNKLLNLLQEDLQGTCPSMQVLLVLETALQCLQPDPKSRPSMSQVVSMLMGGTEVASEILCQLQKATRSPLIDRMEMYKTLFEDTIGDQTTACGDESEERALIPSGSTNSSAIQLVHLSAVRPR